MLAICWAILGLCCAHVGPTLGHVEPKFGKLADFGFLLKSWKNTGVYSNNPPKLWLPLNACTHKTPRHLRPWMVQNLVLAPQIWVNREDQVPNHGPKPCGFSPNLFHTWVESFKLICCWWPPSESQVLVLDFPS